MTEIPDEIMAKAIKRLQKQLKDFDAEATWELANGGERADLWTEIDVSVDDVRFVIDDYTNLIRQNAELRAEIAALLSERTASEAALKEARVFASSVENYSNDPHLVREASAFLAKTGGA